MRPKLIVSGAAGRMGRRILSLSIDAGKFDIIAAIEGKGHSDIGKDAGLLAGASPIDVKLDSVYPADADVVIDFSQPQAMEDTLNYCLTNSAALVLGTTGLSDEQQMQLKNAGEKIPILYATNMSVGMNVMFALAGKVASMLGTDYDIEIVEQHHRFKKDSPSGTALTLAENICDATGKKFPDCLVHGRNGKEVLRKKGEIGMHAVRAGDITGVHSVMFGTLGETLTLNHTASSRDTFAQGALRAAEWLIGKRPGLYSMADCLGLS
ncbi:MAG: 4-hydroxy-tetrahydrodipicolinate reductase [Planctomycetes bacterium]|nr:4-hydroxy-tetrahydrodipicolinate reductase [Planctomycetota bacterium]